MREAVTVSLRSARAGSLMLALGAVIVIETVVLHLLLSPHHPWIALALTLSSISALVWLAMDYRALGHARVSIDTEALHLEIGRRASIAVRLDDIASLTRPGWRDIPESGAPGARSFVNLTKPAEPNLLVTLHHAVTIVLLGSIRKRADRIALHVDEPDAIVTAYRSFADGQRPASSLITGDAHA